MEDKVLYKSGRPRNNDGRRPIQFTAYEEGGKIHCRRFLFIEQRHVLTKLKELFFSAPAIVRVEAYDTELQKVIKTRPTTRGGWRHGSGRKPTDGLQRKFTTTFVISEECRKILQQHKNHSAYVERAVREKHARDIAAAQDDNKGPEQQ